jgi:glycosyltransferase involved in cell wall biosynthesis
MRLLQEKGYAVHAAASSLGGRKEDVEALGVTCWEVPFSRSPYSPANLHAFLRLKALLRGQYFSLIHVHTPVAAFLGRCLAQATRQGPVLYTAHGFHFCQGAPRRNWLIYHTAERVAASWTDGLIVMNDEDFDNASRLGFLPGKNLFHARGVGVDLEHYSTPRVGSIRAKLGIKQDDVVVMCLAEFVPNKNHVFLLSAWKRVSARYGGVHLLLVGTGEHEATIRRKVERERIPQIQLLGYRRDVPQLLQEADIITLVSKREGLARCIMEAMAAGKPVVGTNVRGIRDLVEHGRNGFLVAPTDVPGLVVALDALICSSELRMTMGSAGREAIQEFALAKVLVEMASIYDRYLSQGVTAEA